MNIVRRIINNVKYDQCRRLKDKALQMMIIHDHDEDPAEWNYWRNIFYENLRKCIEMPLY